MLPQFSPCDSLIQPLTLHHKVGHETQSDVMLLGTRLWLDWSGSAPPVAHLTGFQAELALQHLDDFFHFLALPVEGANLFGTQDSSGF